MKKEFERVWRMSVPYLQKGVMKDFVAHTKGVVRAMELLLEQENGDRNVLIPAAILHDVGWYNVPPRLQKSRNEKDRNEALKLHLKYATPVIKKILTELGYNETKIKKITEVVLAHKFQKPRELDKRLLIDADCLSDAFREQFYSDLKSYGNTPEKMYNHRKKNKFYTKTARGIFNKELENRRKEFSQKIIS